LTKAAAETNSNTAVGRATPPAPKVPKGRKKPTGSASGSRSASVVPGGTPGAEAEAAKSAKEEEEEEEADNEDDKLYCICKTKYDEGRFMIACDKYVFTYQRLNRPHLFLDVMNGTIRYVSTCQILT
jgi:COMPASS component SPP1